ncbi:nuclear transport factor 2 family protein [Paraburkholderia dipogonis]|nr:nuclear transport factor 2 family protein [Paraburkholderia dipogonis]
MSSRHHLLELLAAFCDTWAGRPSGPAADLFADIVQLSSSHRGNAQRRDEVLALLRSEFADFQSVKISSSNRVSRANGHERMVGAYVYGEAHKASGATEKQSVSFGGLLILSFEKLADRFRICEVRFQLNWVRGDADVLASWKLPTMDRAWKPGDPPSVVVSELDAPWHRVPISDLPISGEDAIAEAWYRYAWALDQADFALFGECFSEDVETELTPMGRMKGRRELVATLKAFRMPWPWMKHYGEPLQVDIHPDRKSATLVLGRIMPGQTQTPDGKLLYGAHYRIQALQDEQGAWRISQMEYFPGWISIG